MLARFSSLMRPMFGLNLNPGSGGTFSRFSGAPVVRWSARVHYFSSNSPPRKKGIPIDQRGEQKDPGVAQQQKVAARPALRYALVVIVGGGGAIFYSTHLEEVPGTGRRRFMITSAEFEEKLAEVRRTETRAAFADQTLPPDDPITKYVERIVRRIITANNLESLGVDNQKKGAGLSSGWGGGKVGAELDSEGKEVGKPYGPGKTWDVIVIKDTRTVFAGVNRGLIVVFTGLLPVCKDEEGLAGVLSHEIGHVVARHSAERLSSSLTSFAVIGVLQFLGVDSSLGRTLAKYLPVWFTSQVQEMEADTIGLKLLANACYDPASALRVMGRLCTLMATTEKFETFLRAYPSSDIRVQNMEKHLPKAYDMLKSNPTCGPMGTALESFKSRARVQVKLGNKDGEIVDGEIVIA